MNARIEKSHDGWVGFLSGTDANDIPDFQAHGPKAEALAKAWLDEENGPLASSDPRELEAWGRGLVMPTVKLENLEDVERMLGKIRQLLRWDVQPMAFPEADRLAAGFQDRSRLERIDELAREVAAMRYHCEKLSAPSADNGGSATA